MTQDGAILGTPLFLTPEQATSDATEPAEDPPDKSRRGAQRNKPAGSRSHGKKPPRDPATHDPVAP